MGKQIENRSSPPLVCFVLLFLILLNLLWLYLDHSIPAWDDAYYLTNSLRIYDALTDHGHFVSADRSPCGR